MDLIHFLVRIYPDYYLTNSRFIIMPIFAIFMKEEKKRTLNFYQMVNYFTNVLTKMVKQIYIYFYKGNVNKHDSL